MNFERLPDYLRWANGRTLESMKTAPQIEPRAWEIATHLLEAEALWLDRLEGRVSNISWPKQVSPEKLPEAVERDAKAYADYFARLRDSNSAVTYTHSKSEKFTQFGHDNLGH